MRENTLQTEKEERKEIDSLQFSLMNVEFPISILITSVIPSAVFKIKNLKIKISFHINPQKDFDSPGFEAQTFNLILSSHKHLLKCSMTVFTIAWLLLTEYSIYVVNRLLFTL